jgi:hypothetical protein
MNLKTASTDFLNGLVFGFDVGTGSNGYAVRCGNEFPHKASLLIPTASADKKKGLRLAPAPVQELRLLSGSSCDLRSLADRFLRTADPQVLIS